MTAHGLGGPHNNCLSLGRKTLQLLFRRGKLEVTFLASILRLRQVQLGQGRGLAPAGSLGKEGGTFVPRGYALSQ